MSFSGLAIFIIRPTGQYYEPNGASCESKIRSRAARDNDNKKFSIIPGPISLKSSAALPGAMVEHQYPGYLQFFTQRSVPPVFSLILHDGLMKYSSGSETTLLHVRIAAAVLFVSGALVVELGLHLHTRIALLTACGSRPPFHVLPTRGPASLNGDRGVCPSPYTIFELGRFCCLDMLHIEPFR